jgi:hypothetical protein
MAKTSSRVLDKFLVRFPPGMRDKIDAAAKAANRTMTQEIVSRLQFTFDVELVVQDTGYGVGHGLNSPEMMAGLLKLHSGEARPANGYTKEDAERDFGTIRTLIDELRCEMKEALSST